MRRLTPPQPTTSCRAAGSVCKHYSVRNAWNVSLTRRAGGRRGRRRLRQRLRPQRRACDARRPAQQQRWGQHPAPRGNLRKSRSGRSGELQRVRSALLCRSKTALCRTFVRLGEALHRLQRRRAPQPRLGVSWRAAQRLVCVVHRRRRRAQLPRALAPVRQRRRRRLGRVAAQSHAARVPCATQHVSTGTSGATSITRKQHDLALLRAAAGGAHVIASSRRPSRKAALPRAFASSASAPFRTKRQTNDAWRVLVRRSQRTCGLVRERGARLRQRVAHLRVAAVSCVRYSA